MVQHNMVGGVLKEKPSLELLVGQELFPVPQPPSVLPSFNSGFFCGKKVFKTMFFKRS